jgi:hypothetical protein
MIRTGRYHLERAARDWMAAHQGEKPPQLEMHGDGEKCIIWDTRSVATATKHILEGPEPAMLHFADEAPGQEAFFSSCLGLGMGRDEAECRLQELEEKRLVIRRDHRIVSLVLNGPCQELPSKRDLPIGWIEGEDEILARDPLRCKAFWELIRKDHARECVPENPHGAHSGE